MNNNLRIIHPESDEIKLLPNLLNDLVSDTPLIAFCGGRSILKCTSLISQDIKVNPRSKFLNAKYIMIDERLVPLESEDSNYNLLNKTIFSDLRNNPHNQSTIIPFITSDIQNSITEYKNILLEHRSSIDLAFLGVGEDGHIAGLFPNLTWSEDSFFTFNNSPKPPTLRMTASANVIRNCKTIVLLFIGEGKREAWKRFNDGDENVNNCPCLLTKESKNLIIISDLI